MYKENAWQNICTQELTRCLKLKGSQRRKAWEISRNFLTRVKHIDGKNGPKEVNKIIIADINLSNKDLSKFNFTNCYIVRADLSYAKLYNANFYQSIIRFSSIDKADLRAANLINTDLSKGVNGLDKILYDDWTRFNVRPTDLPPYSSDVIKSRAKNDGLRHSYQKQIKSIVLSRIIKFTNYGRSVKSALILFFASLITSFIAYFTIFLIKNYDLNTNIYTSFKLSIEGALGLYPSENILSESVRITFYLHSFMNLIVCAILISTITSKIMKLSNDI